MSEPKQVRNNSGSKSFLASDRIEKRKFQQDISDACVKKNSLVVLPTGLGKTVIGAMVAAKTLQIYPDQSKVIMLAPTRPLIDQHYKSFLKFLEIPENKFSILTGKVPPKDRAELFEINQIIFYTPQTLRNDLVHRKYTLKNTCLIIFDEAHHASGDYPYTLIADEYRDQNPDGNILALTASPGSTKKKIVELCHNLHIPIDNIHIRTRKDADVKTYLKPMDIGKIGVNLTELMKESYFAVKMLIEKRLHYLSQSGFLQKEPDFDKIIRKDLLKLNKELVDMIEGLNGDKSRVYSSISINAQALILYHMIELIEQQGLDILLIYLEKVYKDARKHSSSKAVKVLASEGRLRDVYIELKRNEDLSPQYLTHPKYMVLEQLILQEISKAPESKILVFVKLRDSVKNIVEKLRIKEAIRPVRFVGQATKSKDDKGLSQKKQIAILEQFKTGNFNVLVSTNVGEEGLDIAECDLVIFYDIVSSEIRLIQRKGRTARHREGKVIILYCKNTNDEIYLKIALNKLKKMNANLKNPKSLRSYEKTQKSDLTKKAKISTRSDIISLPKKNGKTQAQYSLQSFLNSNENHPKDVLLSTSLPMDFGIRNMLTEKGISFDTGDGAAHMVLFNTIALQIYKARHLQNDTDKLLTDFSTSLDKSYQILFMIVIFLEFEESYEGEKRLLKRKLHEWNDTSSQNVKLITIDRVEELHYFIENIYKHNKKKN